MFRGGFYFLLGFLGNHPFSTLFFCSNTSRIDQKEENAVTPARVDMV
jgi:hypothetical protein